MCYFQGGQLGEQDRTAPEVVERLNSIDNRYQELMELAKLRKQRLLDALSLYKLFSEADGVEQWIGEKVSFKVFLSSLVELVETILFQFLNC